ncbi:MAG: hypothetical protein ACE5FC_07630 [Myxococcota bacterium]
MTDHSQRVADYRAVLEPLFSREGANAFEFVCALLRVGPGAAPGWDPLQEARDYVSDLNALAETKFPRIPFASPDVARVRMGLVSWNHLTATDAPYQLIANLLRVKAGMPYVDDPFFHLKSEVGKGGNSGKRAQRNMPLSPKRKIDEITRMAELVDCPGVGSAFDGFYFADIHHAVNISEFVLNERGLRMLRRPTPPERTPVETSVASLESLVGIIARAHAFYAAFMELEAEARRDFSGFKGKCVPYDASLKGLLELLIDDEGSLCGIKVHWPNKTESLFRRKGAECEVRNVTADSDGSVNFFVGKYFDDHNPLSQLVPKGWDLEYTPAEGSDTPPRWPETLHSVLAE